MGWRGSVWILMVGGWGGSLWMVDVFWHEEKDADCFVMYGVQRECVCVWNRVRETVCGGKTEIVCKGKREREIVCMERNGKRDRVCVCGKQKEILRVWKMETVCLWKREGLCVCFLCVLDTFCTGVYNVHFYDFLEHLVLRGFRVCSHFPRKG